MNKTQRNPFIIGDRVAFTGMFHSSYKKYKQTIGIVTKIDSMGCLCDWYKDEILTTHIESEYFYYGRLTLLSELKGTPVEQKCKLLWNRSKYVKQNPHLAY